MGKVAERDGVFLFDIGDEGTFVVDLEGEDTVLIWSLEGGSVDAGFIGGDDGKQGETVVRVQHSEFELEMVFGGNDEGNPTVVGPLGKLDLERLDGLVLPEQDEVYIRTYHVVLDPVGVGVDLRIRLICQVVSDSSNLHDTNLLKGPLCNLLGKSLVGSLGLLSIRRLNLQVKEFIREHVCAPRNREAGIIPGLECGNIVHLSSGSPWCLSIRRFLPAVISVRSP